jgi:hypothetical protein
MHCRVVALRSRGSGVEEVLAEIAVVGEEKDSAGRAFAKRHELICERMDLKINVVRYGER